jgi:hypothetical protein
MESSVLMNNAKGGFTMRALPVEAQLSPMYGIAVDDFDGDGNADILMGGNFYESKPEAGIYDASYGLMLKGDGKGGFTALRAQQSGICTRGAIRDIVPIKLGKTRLIMMAKNNEGIEFMQF